MKLSKEKIIQMALEFGWSYYDEYKFDIDELQEFVNAVCAAEREALLLNDARYRFLRNGGWEVLQDTKYWAPENRFDGAIDAARLDVAIDAAIRDRGNG